MVKATITDAIGDLEKASNGEEVRQALIDLIDTMNTIGGDTELLGGYDQTHYVLETELRDFEDEINMWLQYDDEPREKSLKLLKNGNLTKYFVDILKKLQKLNGDTKGNYDEAPISEIGENIRDALNAANNTFNAIKDEIRQQGVTVPDTDSVLDYADRIAEINKTNVEVKPYIVTVNGTEVEETRDPVTHEITKAYTPVTVQLELNGYSETVRTNGSHTVPAGYDGWKNVIVDVDNSGSSASGSSGSSSGGSSGSSKKKGAISSDITYNTSGLDIRENTTYNASAYGVDAFDSATVNVTDYEFEDKKFKVTFMSEGEQLGEPVEVQMGSPACYMGETPVYSKTDEFYYFKGWDPTPNRVVSDMVCEAQFDIWTPNGGSPMKTNSNYITYTWEEIIGGAKVNIGDIKILKLTDGSYYRMRKIGDSESSGARVSSVWMAMDYLASTMMPFDQQEYAALETIFWGDPNNRLREWLNTTFKNLIPESIRSHIVAMPKDSLKAFIDGERWAFRYESSSESIWIPSLHEVNYIGASDKGDERLGNYSNTILTPVTDNTYVGTMYTKFFQWFGTSTPLKNQLKAKYGDWNGSTTPDPTIVARQLYPHVKDLPVTIPQHEDPPGTVIPETTYENWDKVDFTTQVKFDSYETRFDNYVIEDAELGSTYNPLLCRRATFKGATYLNYKELNYNQPVMLRDVIPSGRRYGIVPIEQNYKPDFVNMSLYGIMTPYNSASWSVSPPLLNFCFGLA